MFFNSLVSFSTSVFGSRTMGLELFAASVLALAVVCYLGRVAWIALADAHRMEMKAVRAQASNNRYSGSSTAG